MCGCGSVGVRSCFANACCLISGCWYLHYHVIGRCCVVDENCNADNEWSWPTVCATHPLYLVVERVCMRHCSDSVWTIVARRRPVFGVSASHTVHAAPESAASVFLPAVRSSRRWNIASVMAGPMLYGGAWGTQFCVAVCIVD